MKSKILYLIAVCFFSNCTGFVIKENVVDNYYLIATDIDEQLNLSYQEPDNPSMYATIIGATVFSVGHDEKYIIAKQHPNIFPSTIVKNITNYYILPISEKNKQEGNRFGLIGPLTEDQFNKKREELNISNDLKFTITKENLK